MAVIEQTTQKAVGRRLRWLVSSERAFNLIASVSPCVIVLVTVSDVFMRSVFNSPILGVYEINQVLLIAIVFLGLAYVQSKRGHITIFVVFSRLPLRTQAMLNVVTLILALVISVVITWQGGAMVWRALQIGEYSEGILRFPLWPGRSVLSLGAGLLCIRLIVDISHQLGYFFSRPLKSNPGPER